MAYEASNFDSDVSKLINSGFRPITKAIKAKAFSGRRVIFLMNKLNFITEIIEKKMKILDLDETSAYSLETKIKIGINEVVECI